MPVRIQYTCGQLSVHIQGSPAVFQTQHTGTQLVTALLPCYLRYLPAVFFRRLCLILPSFPQEKIQHVFQKFYNFSLFLLF